MVCSNQLLHKSFDKFDLDSAEGQEICQKYLSHVEQLCSVSLLPLRRTKFPLSVAPTASTSRRPTRCCTSKASSATSQKYWTARKKVSPWQRRYGHPHAGFPYLWVNGEKYSFSQEVLDHGSRLMIEFFKLEHTLREFYGRLTQEGAAAAV